MLEPALLRAHVVIQPIGLQMLVSMIELDVAARRCLIRRRVVFHMIGAQSYIAVVNVHVSIGVHHRPFAPLLLRLEPHKPRLPRRRRRGSTRRPLRRRRSRSRPGGRRRFTYGPTHGPTYRLSRSSRARDCGAGENHEYSGRPPDAAGKTFSHHDVARRKRPQFTDSAQKSKVALEISRLD